MADADVSSEAPEAVAGGGPPKWMLVGFGCMAVVAFLIVLLAAWTMSYMGRLGNKSEAWTSLSDLIAYDESARGTPTGVADDPSTATDESRTPREYELLMGGESFGSGGIAAYWFGRDVGGQEGETLGPNALFVALVKIKSEQTKAAMSARAGLPPHEARTFRLQGQDFSGNVLPEMVIDRPRRGLTRSQEIRGAGTVLLLRDDFLDPNDDEQRFDLLAYFQRPASSERIREEELVRFFEPFDLAGIAAFGQVEEEPEDAGESEAGPATPH